jgi:sarcosine oxidase
MTYDAIVIGLGAMGSAAAYQLARRGAKVLGIDRFTPPHAFGSSHGETRITRQAIGEGEEYVPLALRSYEIWREIEAEAGLDAGALLTVTGGLIMSSGKAKTLLHGSESFIGETVECAQKYGIEHSLLNTQQIAERFPQFGLVGDETGYYENEAGFLRPENCVQAQLDLAKKHGAEIHFNERVLSFSADRNSVEVITEKGTYVGEKLIVSAGPRVNEFIQAKDLFKIYRQVLYWFQLNETVENYLPGNFPIFIWQFNRWADDFIYGFPAIDGSNGGLKLAAEQHLITTDPDNAGMNVTAGEMEKMYRDYVRERLPGLGVRCLKAVSCLYTATPDEGFVIDRHPRYENVLIASPCSGHGFKHSAAVGQILSELALDGATSFDISKFSLARFA